MRAEAAPGTLGAPRHQLQQGESDGREARARCSAWAQMSTIGVAGIDRVAALASGERPDVLLGDARVSGSYVPAERGELTIFASGPGEARSRVAQLFDALGQRSESVRPDAERG